MPKEHSFFIDSSFFVLSGSLAGFSASKVTIWFWQKYDIVGAKPTLQGYEDVKQQAWSAGDLS